MTFPSVRRLLCLSFLFGGGFLLAFLLHPLLRHPSSDQVSPPFPRSGFFGRGPSRPDDPTLWPFRVNVSDADLADLRARLARTRIGHAQLEGVEGFEFGFSARELAKWRDRWLNEFDWRQAEQRLNAMGEQYRTEIEGLQVHFIHARPPNPSAYRRVVPLLLVHGWPGSVFEFHKLVPILVDPRGNSVHRIPGADIAFELVIPSIPGFGWSEQPHKRGFDQVATARMFHTLMVDRLGLRRFVAQGGDWGSLITSNMARMFPDSLLGLHLNIVFVMPDNLRSILWTLAGSVAPRWVFSDPEYFAANFDPSRLFWELLQEGGYYHIQATKPDTVGVALNDSPLGLLAYVLEKFSSWTNPAFRQLTDGGLENFFRKFTRDELLTAVSIYWFAGNILSSQRYYKEFAANFETNRRLQRSYVRVPTGYAAFPHDLGGAQPRELVSEGYNLTRMTLFPDGGHFAALENPKELAEDIVQFVLQLI